MTVAASCVVAAVLSVGTTPSAARISLASAVHPEKLHSAISHVKKAEALEERALGLMSAYKSYGKTPADLKTTENSLKGLLSSSVHELDAAVGDVNDSGEDSETAAPIKADLDTAIGHDGDAISEIREFTGKQSFRREEALVRAALAKKKGTIALLEHAASAPIILYHVGVFGAWNHVQPGVLSHFCVHVVVSSLQYPGIVMAPPYSDKKVKVTLSGPGVMGSPTVELVTGSDGTVDAVYDINQLGPYSAKVVVENTDPPETGSGTLTVTGDPGSASCK